MHCNAARCRVLFVLQTEEGVYSVLCFKSYVNIVNWCQSCRRALVPQAVRWHGRVTNQRVLDCVGLFRHHPPCSSSPTVQRQYATRCEAGGDEPTGHKDEHGLPNSKALLEAQPFQSSPIQLHTFLFCFWVILLIIVQMFCFRLLTCKRLGEMKKRNNCRKITLVYF